MPSASWIGFSDSGLSDSTFFLHRLAFSLSGSKAASTTEVVLDAKLVPKEPHDSPKTNYQVTGIL